MGQAAWIAAAATFPGSLAAAAAAYFSTRSLHSALAWYAGIHVFLNLIEGMRDYSTAVDTAVAVFLAASLLNRGDWWLPPIAAALLPAAAVLAGRMTVPVAATYVVGVASILPAVAGAGLGYSALLSLYALLFVSDAREIIVILWYDRSIHWPSTFLVHLKFPMLVLLTPVVLRGVGRGRLLTAAAVLLAANILHVPGVFYSLRPLPSYGEEASIAIRLLPVLALIVLTWGVRRGGEGA